MCLNTAGKDSASMRWVFGRWKRQKERSVEKWREQKEQKAAEERVQAKGKAAEEGGVPPPAGKNPGKAGKPLRFPVNVWAGGVAPQLLEFV